jgi:hypothetical protein
MARELSTPSDNLLFKPGILRSRKPGAPVRSLTMANVENSQTNLTGSFRFDSPGAPLKSTQQLNVDWSDFSKHTFFNSAQAKVQKAFDKIINRMPFDGTKSEFDAFVDSLTGFEKYVLDIFPTHVGYLAFSGSSSPSNPGTYINVPDFQGAYNTDLSKKTSGRPVVDPGTKPWTVEFYFNSPAEQNDNQVIFQKLSGANGISLVLSSSANKSNPAASVDLLAMVRSGSLTLSASMELTKGQFEHAAVVFDRKAGPGQILLYKNGVQAASSSQGNLGAIDFSTAPVTLGSGTLHSFDYYQFTPRQTLSGALDELRVWHTARTQANIQNSRFLDVFSQPNLAMLYRFNEPSGSFSGNGNNLVLDYSGNGMHATVSNFSMSLRNTGTYGSPPVTGERSINSTVLFPTFNSVTALNTLLLSSASSYDFSNPNLVTRLVPTHYLLEASDAEGLTTEEGGIGDDLTSTYDQPGGARVGQAQIIAGLLYTFSETFDEMKMFVDELKRLLNVDVLTVDTVSNQLLPWLSRYYGIVLPNFYSGASMQQLLDGSNVRTDRLNTTALQVVQNTLWRRMFADLPQLFATRGTHASLRSVLANMGIQPGGPIRIREFGGSKVREIDDSYVRRHEIASLLNFSGTLSPAGTLSAQGTDSNRPFLLGSYLSGSRVEPGSPHPKGVLSSAGTDWRWDGLFTSGSWTAEGIYKFDLTVNQTAVQSLSRMHVTGSSVTSAAHGVLFNLVAKKPVITASTTGSLVLYGRPGVGSIATPLKLELTGVDVFDGQKWHISYGRHRNDLVGSYVSSSYFLRAGKFTPAGLEQYYTTSSYYDDSVGTMLSSGSDLYNASGSFLVVGSQSIDTSGGEFLNDASVTSEARTTHFSGKAAAIRFYSLGADETTTKTHARNFKSVGVLDPEVNFNFVTTASGTFGRLRQDTNIDQPVTKSDGSGDITIFDFSQNGLTMAGTGFETSVQVINPERFDFEVLSANFQSGENPNKVRIRSFLDNRLAEAYGVSLAPLHQIPQSEEPKDDKRVAIEIGVTQGLNEDIMGIFATLNYLDNIIGSPELVFSQDYPHLRNLRRIYFNRLTKKVNYQSFFEFFKWFDDTIGDLLEQMLPSDSKFGGTSYIIESHALERAKFTYKYYDLYLGEQDRGGKEVILMQQIVGALRKF